MDYGLLTFRELAAIAACVTLFVGIFVPAGVKARNMAWRATCAKQLQLVAVGLGRYAEAYDNQLPSVGAVANAYWAPGPRGVVRTSNTRHPYMLVKLKFIDSPALFVCPSRPDARPMLADDYGAFDDLAENANFTYAYQPWPLVRSVAVWLARLDAMLPVGVHSSRAGS